MRSVPHHLMLRITLLLAAFCCISLFSAFSLHPLWAANSPSIMWIKYLGSAGWNWSYSLQPTPGGGFVITGCTANASGEAKPYLAELDSKGRLVWERTFPVYLHGNGASLLTLPKGGYLIGGGINGQVKYQSGKFYISGGDMWAAKTDDHGNAIWTNTYPAAGGNWVTSISSNANSHFYLAGWQYKNRTQNSSCDTRLIKVDLNGGVLWDRAFDIEGKEYVYCSTCQPNGYIYLGGEGGKKINTAVLYKVSPLGTLVWQKGYPGKGVARADSICPTADQNILIAGNSRTLTDNYNDIYLWKINSSGEVIWEKPISLNSNSGANNITSTRDGGYILTGYTQDLVLKDYDLIAIKLDKEGNLLWQKIISLPFDQYGECIRQTTDGGYAICGYTINPISSASIFTLKIK